MKGHKRERREVRRINRDSDMLTRSRAKLQW